MTPKQPPKGVDAETGEKVTPDSVLPPGTDVPNLPPTTDDHTNKGVSAWRPDFDTALPAEIEEFIAGTRPDEQGRDPEAVTMEIMTRILQAKSIEDVFASTQLVHAGEVLNTPLTVRGVKWNKSDFADGPGVYCVVEAFDHVMDHEITVSVGGINAIAQLYMLNKMNALPMVIEFTESQRPTAAGYRPLWLRPRPDVPMKGA